MTVIIGINISQTIRIWKIISLNIFLIHRGESMVLLYPFVVV